MEMPPASSEEKSSSENTGSDTAGHTRRPRVRSRLYRTTKTARSDASDTAAEPAAQAPAAKVPPPSDPAPQPAAATQAPAAVPTPIEGPPGEEQYRGDGGYQENGGGQYQHGKFGRRNRGKHFRGSGKWVNPNLGPKHPPQPPPPRGETYYGDPPDPARFQDLDALETLAGEIASKKEDPIWLQELYPLNHAELAAKAAKMGAKFDGVPNRKQLLTAIFQAAGEQKIPLLDHGWLDLTDRGDGFVVHEEVNYRLYPENAYIPALFAKKIGLKRGHKVEVQVQTPHGNERCPSVVRIRKVMGHKPEEIAKIKPFEELTPYYPLKRCLLERQGEKDVSMRMVDILTPVGFGQRGLIVAPPRTGKTILLQNMANSIAANAPEARLIILLIDERPEEVTDFRRHCKGEVVSSTFDESPESHVHCAEMVIEKARRLVEAGEHVVILLDSITRLARAYNALASNSGKIMSGGLEATALQKPKRFFGSARNIDSEGGGSLTILGTALVDTGSRMDEIIFEEFKGTGNMELHLDRDLSNKRIFPAINIDKSGTRKEELIYHPEEITRVYALRRAMQGVPAADSMDMLIGRLKKTKTNAEFLMSLNR